MTTQELVDKLSTITNWNVETVQHQVAGLTADQMNWRPNENSWNINEVLAHLNAFATYYHGIFIKKIESTRFLNTKENFVSSPLGKSTWKSRKLGNARNVKRKFKSPREYNPVFNASLLSGNQLEKFLNFQEEMLTIIEKASNVNLKRVKIPISTSKAIRLRLGDALLYVVYHNERHVQQVVNLINHRNFPKQ